MKKILSIVSFGLFVVALTAYAQTNPAEGLFISFPSNDPYNVAARLVRFFLGLMSTVCLLFVVYGGLLYLTAGSNGAQALQGRKYAINAIMGLIIAILSYIIVVVVVNSLNRV